MDAYRVTSIGKLVKPRKAEIGDTTEPLGKARILPQPKVKGKQTLPELDRRPYAWHDGRTGRHPQET